MEHDRLNTIDPTVAKRWITEYEKNEVDLLAFQARYRNGRKSYVERRNSIIERAVDAGLNSYAFKHELKTRALERKIAEITSGEAEEIAEQRELLKKALGGLPLGDWGVKTTARTEGSKRATSETEPPAPAGTVTMTLEEAKAIFATPKGKGRPSARRKAAEAIVAGATAEAGSGASGAQAEAIAEAMGQDDAEPVEAAPDALSSLVDEDNVTDLRPRFMHGQGPQDAA